MVVVTAVGEDRGVCGFQQFHDLRICSFGYHCDQLLLDNRLLVVINCIYPLNLQNMLQITCMHLETHKLKSPWH